MDKINIKNLEVFGNHGVLAEETKLGQKFIVSATLYTDIRGAGRSDDLSKSIDYGQVAYFIKNFIEENTYNLLETVAEELAGELLLNFERLNKVWIEIKKPFAPIALPLETVSVELERGWHTAYIALGSNIGEREKYVQGAVEALSEAYGCEVTKVSSFIETEPYGGIEQGDFLNGCLELKTLLTPFELLKVIHEIEAGAKRERTVHWGPRTLDLDILLYDDEVIQTEMLQIPHMEMHRRWFVMEPLCEIAPYKRHPIYGKTVAEMLEGLDDETDK